MNCDKLEEQKTLIKANDGQYTVVAPGTIHSQRDYNVAVAVHHTKEPVTIKIGFTGPTHIDSQTVELPQSDAYKQLTFKLPALEKGDYNLTAEGISGLKFHNTSKLNLGDFRSFVKVQTDKGKYKPGDIINYRVIFLDENLRPAREITDIEITFLDSKNNRITKLENIKVINGVFRGKLEISENATLGLWSLCIKSKETRIDERVHFTVEKYVLPKYTISMDSPKQVSAKDGHLQVVVRAEYTYGKPVNGKTLLTLKTEYPNHTILSHGDMINGRAKFDLDIKELVEVMKNFDELNGKFTAIVEENFTGVKLEKFNTIQIYSYRYQMSLINGEKHYKFGEDNELDFSFKINLIDGTLVKDTKSKVIAKFTADGRKRYPIIWGQRRDHYPDTYPNKKTYTFEGTLNEDSIAKFKVKLPKLPHDEGYFSIHYFVSLEFDGEERRVVTLLEDKGLQAPKKCVDLEVELQRSDDDYDGDDKDLKVGKNYTVIVNSSRPLSYFLYHIVARGNVIHTERVQLSEPTQSHSLSLTPTFLMCPVGRIYVYYVDSAGEFRYAETSFNVQMELPNQIELNASEEEVKPGEEVTLEIKTEPKSFVGLLAVDQSVLLLGAANDLEKDTLGLAIKPFSTTTPWQGGYSYFPGEKTGVVTFTNSNFFYNRNPPIMQPCFAFCNSDNISFRGHQKISTTAQLFGSPAATAAGVGQIQQEPQQLPLMNVNPVEPVVRKNFAETWIYDDIEETPSKVFKWTKTIPDTITSWVLSAFALHPEKGLGLTDEKTNIKTFQPFFVSVRLPYSVKRGEVINVPALVFNYLPQALDVEVTLDNTDDEFDFVDPSNEIIEERQPQQQQQSQSVRIEANDSAGLSFLLRPKVIGNLMLKFKAISPIAGDAIHKTLKVIPEGITQYSNRARFINLNASGGEFKDNFELEPPPGYVKDSQSVEFAIAGDLLGPVLKNLDMLIRLPSGCGEQTMSAMIPNYLARDYLIAAKQLTPDVEERIIRNLTKGYQNMLRYRHLDGSFSSFGPSTDSGWGIGRKGSIWLTAYVLRHLSNITSIVAIDENLLQSGYVFLLSQQADNGSFVHEGECFYSSQCNSLTLTASVLLALLERPHSKEKAIDKAVGYLTDKVGECKELLPEVIATYALLKAKSPEAAKHLAILKSLAKQEDDLVWWSEKNTNSWQQNPRQHWWWNWINCHDVETTAYALLSLLEEETDINESVFSALRWLVKQRNSFGGFGSSQDTVVGLQALIKFAQKADYEPGQWNVTVSSRGACEKTETLTLSKENHLQLQRVQFPMGTTSLSVMANGVGSALLQMSYQYNIVEKEPKPSFKIHSVVKADNLPSKLELQVKVEYVEEGRSESSNMAILEVTLPSGYTVDKDDFDCIKAIKLVRLIETKNDDTVIMIYFEKLPRNEVINVDIKAQRDHDVAEQKPSPVVIYDYYDINRRATDYYDISPQQSTKDNL